MGHAGRRLVVSLNGYILAHSPVAGGGAYYFAKKSIDSDKKARFEAQQRRRQLATSLEESSYMKPTPSHRKDFHKGNDHSGSPSGEASSDPAPTSHGNTNPAPRERSKYEPKEPFRSKKGDRFSSLGTDGRSEK